MSQNPHPNPLRIGILGAANIARQFARDVAPSRAVRLAAVASRSADKAAAFATEFGIPRWHAGYEGLLADGGIDAVYIPLPNHLHGEWAIKAVEHGKHVLCEKPLALHRAEAAAMFDAARRHGVMLLEAYPYWFQPQTGQLVELLQAGAIGRVQQVQASFGFTLRKPDDIRMRLETGGGALLDVGSYLASLVRLVMGRAPRRASATSTPAATGVDIATTATLDYGDGCQAQLRCAMNVAQHRHASIVGSDGWIETEFANHTADAAEATEHPWGYRPSLMRLRRGATVAAAETLIAPAGSGFRFAAEAFARVLRNHDRDAIERAAQASVDIAATLDAIAASARADGAWVALTS
ncbi:MAG: Gfo/Idh/MocA family oxidoreductase [Proteobacteria bacterium]|nr:Gfo/Idh/MocA family oxidoreductase [Pseudomonadota bacterium]